MKLSAPYQKKWDLLFLLTQKEVALKYKRTFLGIFWSILNPVLSALVYYVAFKIFMRFQHENYTFFLLSVLFPWMWLQSSITIGARSLVDNVSLIKKTMFPRTYLVGSVVLAQSVNFIFSLPILIGLSIGTAQGPSWAWILGILILFTAQTLMTLGLCLIVAITNVYFRDVEFLVTVVLNFLFWLTPITYPITAIPERFRAYAYLNPLTSLTQAWRGLFTENRIIWNDVSVALLMSVIFLWLGKKWFGALERRLDEVL